MKLNQAVKLVKGEIPGTKLQLYALCLNLVDSCHPFYGT